jgi:hypothetical protein
MEAFIAGLASLGLKIATLAGGFFGALVSLKFIDGLSLRQRGSTVFAGTLVSAYVTPVIVAYLELSPKMEGGIAFLCGLFGMSFTGAVIKAMPEWIAALKDRVLK